MNSHNREKYALEEAALQLFLDLYHANHSSRYTCVERRESPDFVLRDDKGESVGAEVAHLFYNAEEARMLLGRSTKKYLALQKIEDLINVLNELMRHKEAKREKYESSYPNILLIRNTSPIWGISDVLRMKGFIQPTAAFERIWFISRDGSYKQWVMKNLLDL
ncbi:hypothetical protein [Paenibacillus sp. HB172176]|uniref:hypothetical protein n=1 Tax=Paenibacillus sp. HB172176 TaxID=2493690 RepID=UPI001439E3DA|nr:hypothetical protein [Paenibacillus sp. HB172176]